MEPANDPTMVIELYANGQPLLTGSRVYRQFDFGYLTAGIRGVIPEDAGEYTIRAVNALGEAQVSGHVDVEC